MILNADDFGISPAVDEGILQLIERNRISSTSCMVNVTSSALEQNIMALKKYKDKIDVGLHLVLTETQPLSELTWNSGLINKSGHFFSIKELTKRAYLGELNEAAIEFEIKKQIEKFKIMFGQAPDFIDGHQHVQQLPIIRNAIVTTLRSFTAIRYVRTANLPNRWIWNSAQSISYRFAFENLALAIPGRRASALFARSNIPHNRFLLGYYRHIPGAKFENIFKSYMTIKPQVDDIFFCHPGYIDEHLKNVDTLVDSRQDNLEFLLSDEFEDLCGKNEINLNKFSHSKFSR